MILSYHLPENLSEALRLVAGGAIPIAGGTGMYTSSTRRDIELVDITRLKLDTITIEDNQVSIGSGVTLTQLADVGKKELEIKIPGGVGRLLRTAAAGVASRSLRNVITIGGNLAHKVYWADLPVILAALDAKIGVLKAGEEETLHPVWNPTKKSPSPWSKGLITRVVIPLTTRAGFGYERFVRTSADYPLATACVTVEKNESGLSGLRIVLGAIASSPFRAIDLETKLEGRLTDEEFISEAVLEMSKSVPMISNYRAPEDYRRTLVNTLVRRALTNACQMALKKD